MKSAEALGRTPSLLKTEMAISTVLKTGVILCSCIIAFGLALKFYNGLLGPTTSEPITEALTQGRTLNEGSPPQSLPALLEGLRNLNPESVMALGLLLLIILPIIRVAMTLVLFFIERDWIFLGITSTVLSTLLLSLTLGKAL